MKKKINNSYLIADVKLENVTIVSEEVVKVETNSGNEGFLARVKFNNEERMLFMDGGLRGALKQAKILNKENTVIKSGIEIDIVPTGKKELDEGFVYTYDIYA